MPATSVLAGLNEEATQLELLGNITTLLAAMLERMPRVTGNDQVAASIETIPAVSIAANQDLRNITGALANITSVGSKTAATSVDALNMAGAAYIYNNITVS